MFIIGINLSLFWNARKKMKSDVWIRRISAAGRTLREPFKTDNDRMSELSKRVQELQDKKNK
jgi:hypothetical protein